MDNCIFCKIISGDIPSHKVYEDDNFLCLLDIMPINPGHTLVIPKSHTENVTTISKENFSELMNTVYDLAPSIKTATGATGLNISSNHGVSAGQEVPHIHIHIIPRHDNEEKVFPTRGKYSPGEAEEILHKIKSCLQKN